MKQIKYSGFSCRVVLVGLFLISNMPGITQNYDESQIIQSLNHYLLPRPSAIELTGGYFQITDTTHICYYDTLNLADKSCRFVAERFNHLVKDNADYTFQLYPDKQQDQLSLYLINTPSVPENLKKTDNSLKGLGDQGYILDIREDGIRVSANTYRGLLWGMMTLKQVITSPVVLNDAVPCIRVRDKPYFIWRGFQLDAGRATFSMGLIKRMIRICSVFKLNQLYFREGDDELNAVKYDHLPVGHKNPGALTMEEIRELIDYADQYGMDFIPEIESLGHAAAKAFHYPDLLEGGFQEEYWEGLSHTRKAHFNIDNPESYKLLEVIYDEWFAIMKTPMIHLGLDEVNLPMEKQAEHLKKLLPLADKVAKKHGKTMKYMMWSDAPPHPEEFNDRVIRCLWAYDSKVSSEDRHLVKQGILEYSKKGCEQTVVMAGGSGSTHEPYIFTGPDRAYINMVSWALWGRDKPNFKGLYAVQWHGNMVDLWLPNYIMSADLGWHPPESMPDTDTELARINMHKNRIRDAANPNPDDVDSPVWDAIWLDGREWGRDIMTGKIAGDPAVRLRRIVSESVHPDFRTLAFREDYFEFTGHEHIMANGNRKTQEPVEAFLDLMQGRNDNRRYQSILLDEIDHLCVYLIRGVHIHSKLRQAGKNIQALDEEGYALFISEHGIKVSANTREALSKGLTSLHKILNSPAKRYGVIPGMYLEDILSEE